MRVVAYARVSSKEQADKELSIPAQLKALRKYCQDKEWNLVGEYIDEARSAKTTDRPAFQKMIALAKKQNRHFDAIVVHKFDRFSRSRDDHVIYKALLKKLGVSVYSITEQTDPETPHGFLLEGILEVISEFYNMNLATETRKGMVENAKRGFHNGGSPPYGYKAHRFEQHGSIKTTWVLGPEEQVETIQRIFHLYAYEGLGYKKIARTLNDEGVPSPGKSNWSYTTVWHILHNEAYVGTRVWNKQDSQTPGKKYKPEEEWIRTRNAHPAIVSQEMFDLVKRKASEKNAVYPGFRAGKSPYVLRGLLYCPNCGGRMVSTSSGSRKDGKKHIHRYYVCGNYHRKGKSVCTFKSFQKEHIEKQVIDIVIRELLVLSLPLTLEEAVSRFLEESQRDNTSLIKRIQADIEIKEKHVSLLKEDIHLMSKPEIIKHIDALESEIIKLQSKKEDLEKEGKSNLLDKETMDLVRQNMRHHAQQLSWDMQEVKGQILRTYVERMDFINDALSVSFKVTDPTQKMGIIYQKSLAVELY